MRVTTKGQVTIPLAIRKRLKISPATEVDFVVGEDGRVYLTLNPGGGLLLTTFFLG
jgi:AbrB family looped-hinge helix DNA binding protein